MQDCSALIEDRQNRLPRRAFMGACGATLWLPRVSFAACSSRVRGEVVTLLGKIEIEFAMANAPISCANFLSLVKNGVYDGAGTFYRSVAPSRDANPMPINVIQGGLGALSAAQPAIVHESTNVTGLRHRDGTISMARGAPGSASSEFFICLGDNPELDAGGRRNPDGQGFAAFGQVSAGMDVVRRIHAAPTSTEGAGTAVAGQLLQTPVAITRARRL